MIGEILESHFWLPGIQAGCVYRCLHDDHEETDDGYLHVSITCDGDVHIWITLQNDQKTPSVLRFRMPGFGGGESPRTRIALMILADAIRRDKMGDNAPDTA